MLAQSNLAAPPRSQRPTIAIVDDDPGTRFFLRAVVEQSGAEIIECDSAAALQRISSSQLAAVCLDLGLEVDGMKVLSELIDSDPNLPVIVITSDHEAATVVTAMRRGAYDYLTKPIDPDLLTISLGRAIERRELTRRVCELSQQMRVDGALHALIGESAVMHELRRQIARTAQANVSTFVCGETGTGKELVARAIHGVSDRRNGPFVALNCGAIASSLQESELFGHERGAFTGAQSTHAGRFEQAHGGSLFLDEIAEMSPSAQASLLRTVQERTIRRVGSSREIEVNVRIISATHVDLERAVAAGEFREDLFYRLVVFPIEVPPLRDRLEDIPLLAAAFLRKFAKNSDAGPWQLSNDSVHALMSHDWPGNVRELQNVLHRACLLTSDGVIRPGHLHTVAGRERAASLAPRQEVAREPIAAIEQPRRAPGPIVFTPPAAPAPANDTARPASDVPPPVHTTTPSHVPVTVTPLDRLEHKAIVDALRATGGNVTRSARLLGLGRATLYRRIQDLDIDLGELRPGRN